ncbi:MBL fold metallo-hydrolase [Candidatus Microgenomates bacterium]|nr:MBL fold metallo-hydrolase [Candidatus Microgenomates bacterium]
MPLNVTQKLKAVLISHAHPDHILGLWDLPHIYGRNENEVDKIKLFVTREVLNNIRSTFFSQFQPIVVSIQKPLETFNIEHAKITYFPVIHGKTPAFGIKYKNGKFIAYIPDFNRILPSSQRVIRDCHVLIIDGSSLGKLGQSPGHISIQDGITISKNLKAKSVYFVHIGHKTGTHKFLENYLRKNAGRNFHIAYDGLQLEV